MSFCGCWNKIWIGVMVFSAVVCGTLTHMSIRSGSLVMEFFLCWIKKVTVLSQILNSKIQICFSFWIDHLRDHPFKTSANFHNFWPLPPHVGKFGRFLTPPPLKNRSLKWMVPNVELTKVGHNFIKVLKKEGFSQAEIFNRN